MRSELRRLRAIARRIGCPRHGELLTCAACQTSEPLPPRLGGQIGRFITGVLQRVGREGIAAAMRGATPPFTSACPRCQGRRVCATCQEIYLRAIFRHLVLTPAELEALETLLGPELARLLYGARADASSHH
jgi:hypothetical protein